jgi:cytochrome d ubiquinol oxidase subunit II
VEGTLQANLNPMALAFGAVSVAATAFSGATFLVGDARRYGAVEMVGYFRRRVVVAAAVLVATGTIALVVIALERSALLRSMLAGPGVPFALVTVILVPLVAFLIWRGALLWYRVLTVAAVGSMVFAWGFAQSPYLLPGRLTIAQAIAPPGTQAVLLAVTILLVVVIAPSMALLYYLDQKNTLESPETES